MPNPPKTRALIVTCMRDEGPFLLEWLAHHKAIGFTDFLIYSNDCEDGTDLMLDRLAELGEITHIPNPALGKKTVQWQALSDAATQPIMQEVDWIYGTDVDEFLNIKVGDGHLNDLFAASPDTTGFALAWRMFGNNGITAFQDQPVTEQFTRCAPTGMLWPWRAIQFKCLYRNDGSYEKLGVHMPKKPNAEKQPQTIWRDGSGNPFPGNSPKGSTLIPTFADQYELAQINHYALGSVENYLVKEMRGKPNHSTDAIDLAYWVDRNFNDVEDHSIQRTTNLSAPILSRYKSDKILSALHDKSIQWRQAQIRRLLTESDAFYLYARAIQAGSTMALSQARQHQLFHQLMKMRHNMSQAKLKA
ncbi:MAG: glycosyl transferase family 2 [Rhodobacteraceae bacterium]|nr:MAG: glycosyl transferase family 2 [Paracoccaceae bacterium]